MTDFILVREKEGIAEITLNRPEAYNAFDLEMMTALADQLVRIAADDSVRGVLITGQGKAFCAGGDLKWALDYAEKPSASFHKLASQFHLAILEIRRMAKPVVAALNGAAAGGGFSLALACDFRLMERSAVLKQAYTSSGLCIDGGGTFSLPRLVGLARALEIAAFDKPISAQQALDWGLVTQVVEDGAAVTEATAMLETLVKKSNHSLGLCKRLFSDSFHQSLEMQLELEREGLSRCSEHADGLEGLKAFVEKRKASFIPVKTE